MNPRTVYGIGLVLTLVDGLATRLAVHLGSYEANPLLAYIQTIVGLEGMLTLRVVFGWFALTVLYRLALRHERLVLALRMSVLALALLAGYHAFLIYTYVSEVVQY